MTELGSELSPELPPDLTPDEIRQCLNDIGRSQTDLAQILGCKRCLVSQWLSGARSTASWTKRLRVGLRKLVRETKDLRREQRGACEDWVRRLKV